MRLLLFGTGEYYRRYKKWFAEEEIVALLDNSPEKKGKLIDGIQVLPPEEGIKRDYNIVIILSYYVREMKKQLLELGVPGECIYHFYDMHELIHSGKIKRPMWYLDNTKEILLMSLDLEFGGPALALFHTAGVLVKQGYRIMFAAMVDGPLRDKLVEQNIPVIVDASLQISTMKNAAWTKKFDLIICNTLNFHIFLSERDTGIPVIWWLHDSSFFYHGVNKKIIELINPENLLVCSVGVVPEQAVHELIPEMPVRNLIYGVEDVVGSTVKRETVKKNDEKMCFVTIGYIEKRKGQDILVQAIRRLPKEMKDKADFYFVGDDSSVFAAKIAKQIREEPEIIITGKVDRDRINELLNKADLLICPSREDPMPTVAAEAMMHSVPCLVSDAAGTGKYLEDGINGLVFESENVLMLLEKIKWCLQNRDNLQEMKKAARKIYEEYFSMEVFERNLMGLINEMIYGEKT